MGFGELDGPFQAAADVVGAGAHVEIVGDGIEAIDESFGKTDKDGTFVGGHGNIFKYAKMKSGTMRSMALRGNVELERG